MGRRRAQVSGAPNWTRDAKGRLVRAAEEVKPRASGLKDLPVELLPHVLGYLPDHLRRFFRVTQSLAAARTRGTHVECVDTNLVPYHHMMPDLRSSATARLAPRKLRLGTLTVDGSEMALVVSWLLAKIDFSRLVDVDLHSITPAGSHMASMYTHLDMTGDVIGDDVLPFREYVSWKGPASKTVMEALASVQTIRKLALRGASAAMGSLRALEHFPLEKLQVSVEAHVENNGQPETAYPKQDVAWLIPRLGSLRELRILEKNASGSGRLPLILRSSTLRVVDVTNTAKHFALEVQHCPNLRHIYCKPSRFGNGPREIRDGRVDPADPRPYDYSSYGRVADMDVVAGGKTFVPSPKGAYPFVPSPYQSEPVFTLPPSCVIHFRDDCGIWNDYGIRQ